MGWVSGLTKGDRRIFETFVPRKLTKLLDWYLTIADVQETEYFCDVIDIARLHVAALLDPNTVSRRLFGFATPVNLTDMISVVRKLRPNNTLIPDPPVDEGRDLSEVIPAKDAERLLREFCGRKGWTSLEDSIAQGLEVSRKSLSSL